MLWCMYMIDELMKCKKNLYGVQFWGLLGVLVWFVFMVDVKCGLVYVGMGENYSMLVNDMSDVIIVFK